MESCWKYLLIAIDKINLSKKKIIVQKDFIFIFDLNFKKKVMKFVRLTVLGFSFNQMKTGTYGLVLAEIDGPRRLMIVVGAPEAQSIALRLQNIKPPRPLSHDLMKTILNNFDIYLKSAVIDKYDDGVFYSSLMLTKGDITRKIDSRTSDAIALALRVGAPIYTTEEIMQTMSVVFADGDKNEFGMQADDADKVEVDEENINRLDIQELREMLQIAIQEENYEKASLLRDEINKKKQSEK